MFGFDPQEMEHALITLESVRDEWMRRPGVTAVDLGYKWSSGQMTDSLAIRVHVTRKKDRSELREEELFPEQVDGLAVDVIEATYAPQTTVNSKLESAVDGRGDRFDDIPIGVSIGSKFTTAGTLGAKVIDSHSGDEMILSNWHVMAGRLDIEEGTSIWQPGWIDGGTREENTIAQLSRWVLGPYDAAVARLSGARKVQTKTLEGHSILETTDPHLGMMVWKSGRSTGFTEGMIDGMKMKISLSYRGAGTHSLEQVFRIVPRPGSRIEEISIGGDSGSVWVDETSGKAVGLHFAGEIGSSPEHALAHDIGIVTRALDVHFPGQEIPVDQDPPNATPPSDSRPPPTVGPIPSPPRRRRSTGSPFLDVFSDFLNRLFGSK
jgi:hypothetical protein